MAMFYKTQEFTGSVLRSSDRTPFYGPNKRDPKGAPYMSRPGGFDEEKHDPVRSMRAIGEPLGERVPPFDEIKGENRMTEIGGQKFYRGKRGPGGGDYNVPE